MKVYSAGAIIVALLTISTSTKAFATPTFHVLYNFSGWSDGRGPSSTLILNRSGIVYGTTENGGDTTGQGGCSNRSGCGVVFKIDTTGHETVIHTFEGSPTDGEGPRAGLVRDAHGDLFGTTTAGGATNSGVVFMITPRGKEKILYSFCPNFPSCPDGRTPFSGLIFDAVGDLLGTTVGGGVDSGNCGGSNTYGCGVVYSINPSGQESVVYSFLGAPTDGMGPFDALTADATGDL